MELWYSMVRKSFFFCKLDFRSNNSLDKIQLKFVYCTPETLVHNDMLQNFLRKLNSRKLLQRIVIDEAHCVSQWGPDFRLKTYFSFSPITHLIYLLKNFETGFIRPEYNKIHFLKEEYPHVPFMMLTATARQKTRKDIVCRLGIQIPRLLSLIHI